MKSKDRWQKYIDSALLYLLMIFVMVMLVAQLLLLKEGTRLYLSKVDKMEGKDLRIPDKGLLSPQDDLRLEGKKRIFPAGKIKFKNE